jgi:hypothetical protein
VRNGLLLGGGLVPARTLFVVTGVLDVGEVAAGVGGAPIAPSAKRAASVQVAAAITGGLAARLRDARVLMFGVYGAGSRAVHRRLSTMAAIGKQVIDTPAIVVASVDARPDLNSPIIDDLASNVMSKISGGAVIPLNAAEK